MSFSTDLCHTCKTHKHRVQCNFSAVVDGMFFLSESARIQMAFLMMSNHCSCFIAGSPVAMEWYKVAGDENSKADACARKYISSTHKTQE